MSAIKPEAYAPALAVGLGGSNAEWDVDPQFIPYVPPFAPALPSPQFFLGTFGSVCRVRTPEPGYVGSWVVTLGGINCAGTDDKGNIVWPWSGTCLPKAVVRWGTGGAGHEALVDWPVRGYAFGLTGEFVEVNFGALSSTDRPFNRYVGLKVSVVAAISPGQHSVKGAQTPWCTFPLRTFPAPA